MQLVKLRFEVLIDFTTGTLGAFDDGIESAADRVEIVADRALARRRKATGLGPLIVAS